MKLFVGILVLFMATTLFAETTYKIKDKDNLERVDTTIVSYENLVDELGHIDREIINYQEYIDGVTVRKIEIEKLISDLEAEREK